MGGYIKIPQWLFESRDFSGERYSKREAFIDLIQMATFGVKAEYPPGFDIHVEMGQVAASRGFLAARWGWDKGRVRRFLDELCRDGRCSQDNGRITIITIADYDSYIVGGVRVSKAAEPPRPEDDKALAVSRLYSLYPTKCPVSGRATGKSSKDKEKLARLLKDHTEQELSDTIRRYIKESTEQQSYIKNFSTFLNNLPDYSTRQEKAARTTREESYEDAIKRAKNPTNEEVKEWWDKRMAPFYPKNDGETDEQFWERVRPFYESQRESWIQGRIERAKQRYL